MSRDAHTDLVQQYFDRHAQDWHDYYREGGDIVDTILIERKDITVRFLAERLPAGARILDAGCGAGITAIELGKRGFQVEGIDISSNMIELALDNLAASGLPEGAVRFRKGNLLAESAPEKPFDCVIALGFIQYQPDEVQALGSMAAWLKPGGLLVVSGPVRTRFSNYFGLSGMLRNLKRRVQGEKPPEPNLLHTISANDYSAGRFRELLERAGMEMLSFNGHGYIHFEYLSRRLNLKTQVRMHQFFTRLAAFLPIGRFANDIVVTARKPDA